MNDELNNIINGLANEIASLKRQIKDCEKTIKNNLAVSRNSYQNIGIESDFFEPYIDENGEIYYFISQNNPYMRALSYGGGGIKNFGGAACSACSNTNGFIRAFGVHSFLDTMVVLKYYSDLAGTTQVNTGKNVENLSTNHSKIPSAMRKYLYDENGNLRVCNIRGMDSDDKVAELISSGDTDTVLVFQFNVQNDNKARATLLEVIETYRDQGLNIVLSGMSAGTGDNLFGSYPKNNQSDESGHYITVSISQDGTRVIDSFTRTLASEREGDMTINSYLGEEAFVYNQIGAHQGLENRGVDRSVSIERENLQVLNLGDVGLDELYSKYGIMGTSTVYIWIEK